MSTEFVPEAAPLSSPIKTKEPENAMGENDHVKDKRVAVIAVHGVGHNEAGSTVRHIADLLLGLGRFKLPPKEKGGPQVPWDDPPITPPYSSFKTQPIQVPLKAAPVSQRRQASQRILTVVAKKRGLDPNNPGLWLSLKHYLDERRGYIAEVFAGTKTKEEREKDLDDRARLGHEFMRAQLAGYVSEPEGKSYDTICLETEIADGAKKRTVHLYETYWADLARPQNSIWSFFLAFYQLLLHLGSLSRTAIDYAVVEHYDMACWRWHAFWQGWAVRFLVLPITLLNLYLLLAGLSGLPLKLPWDRSVIAALGLAALALLALLKWPTVRDAPGSPVGWIVLLFTVFVVGGLVGYGLSLLGRPDFVLAIEWWLLGGGLLYLFVLKPYDEVRRGAASIGIVFYVLSFGGFLYCLCRASRCPGENPVDQASFWTMQIIMAGLILSWLGLLFSTGCAYVLHFECLRVLDRADEPQQVRARAALRTGRLTLATSASLFLVVTIFLWAGVYRSTRERLHLHTQVQLTQVPLPRPVAQAFRWLLPTLDDAIRWTHQPKSPAPDEDARLSLLEHWDWDPTPVCTREPRQPALSTGPQVTDSGARLRQLELKAGIPANLILGKEPDLQRIERLERYARVVRLQQWNWSDLPGCRPTAQPAILQWPALSAQPGPWSPEIRQPYENDILSRVQDLEGVVTVAQKQAKIDLQPKPDSSGKKIDCTIQAGKIDGKTFDKITKIDVNDEDGRWLPKLDTESRLYRLELLAQPTSEPAIDVYANALMLVSATAALPFLLIGFALALTLLVWAVVPCLLVNTYTLTQSRNFNNRVSGWLGNWYSRGLDSTRVITWLMWHSIFTLAFVFGILDFAYSHGWFNPDFLLAESNCLRSALGKLMYVFTGDALHVLTVVGSWLAVSGAVVAAFVYRKGRVVLDIILDVDHYLRTSPLERAPRARIAERYTSLLRLIATRKDERDQPYYTSVVIAAHSLGALISADLLQYLKRECEEEPDSELDSLGFRKRPDKLSEAEREAAKKRPATPIYLFTFGNPLRQLLNRFFPHLYWWIREAPDNALNPLPNAVEKLPAISDTDTPDPSRHNLHRWVSAYRSGDFVGRSLWLNGWFSRTEEGPAGGAYSAANSPAKAASRDGLREEFCIGPGGHNNYWDRSAPDIAHVLDKIIRES